MDETVVKSPENPEASQTYGASQPAEDVSILEGQVKDALRTVYDP